MLLFRKRNRIKDLERNIKELCQILGLGTYENESGGIEDIHNSYIVPGQNESGALSEINQKLDALAESLGLKLKRRKAGGFEAVERKEDDC
ncbi:MAG TPA: hypothetical protein ENI13_01650 [candidate division CPR3 bacterium]|uniref:Uncharacterized protein n=1 Tax=candidate division CPR3 bacterium TaxID=2268181 RepID=A0A7C1NSN4_UNCC3|nr:hypothetical protein [candidate division CPR3 bacterium]